MPKPPKETEERIHRMINGWKTLAPAKNYGGMTLAEFEAFGKASLDAREKLDDIEDQKIQAIAERDNADAVFNAKAQLVVNGVLADPDEGEDSALYEAFGYVRKSNRKSGLTRKKNDPEKK